MHKHRLYDPYSSVVQYSTSSAMAPACAGDPRSGATLMLDGTSETITAVPDGAGGAIISEWGRSDCGAFALQAQGAAGTAGLDAHSIDAWNFYASSRPATRLVATPSLGAASSVTLVFAYSVHSGTATAAAVRDFFTLTPPSASLAGVEAVAIELDEPAGKFNLRVQLRGFSADSRNLLPFTPAPPGSRAWHVIGVSYSGADGRVHTWSDGVYEATQTMQSSAGFHGGATAVTVGEADIAIDLLALYMLPHAVAPMETDVEELSEYILAQATVPPRAPPT